MNKIIIYFTLITLVSSCRDVFETDISKETVLLIAPFDNSISENLNADFQWSEVEGATGYNIQIVSPRFDTTHYITYDSLANTNNLTLSLSPGKYEWRVRAENNAYKTEYSTIYSFTIDSSYNLNNQSILLNSPTNGKYFNDDNIAFQWQDLYAASSYNIVIKEGNNWTTGNEVLNDFSVTNSYSNSVTLSEGEYIWGVSGSNNLPSNTPFSSAFSFYLDYTSPPTPVLVAPNSSTSGLLEDSLYMFNWTRPTDVGVMQSPLFDSVKIYNDTLILPIYSYGSLSEDMEISLPPTGTYFWRVVTYDEAGNESTASTAKMFDVQ